MESICIKSIKEDNEKKKIIEVLRRGRNSLGDFIYILLLCINKQNLRRTIMQLILKRLGFHTTLFRSKPAEERGFIEIQEYETLDGGLKGKTFMVMYYPPDDASPRVIFQDENHDIVYEWFDRHASLNDGVNGPEQIQKNKASVAAFCEDSLAREVESAMDLTHYKEVNGRKYKVIPAGESNVAIDNAIYVDGFNKPLFMTKIMDDGVGFKILYPSSTGQWMVYTDIPHDMCKMMCDRANDHLCRFYGKAEMAQSGDSYIVTLKVEKF